MITQLISAVAITLMTLFYLLNEENTPTREATKLRIITETVDIYHILLNSNDKREFDQKQIRVREWERIRITLRHTGIPPKDVLGHNFVLLAEGTDLDSFARIACTAGDTCYVPSGNVLAHTRLIGGGESPSVEFNAPPQGVYDFISTFPGSHLRMKGKFVVE